MTLKEFLGEELYNQVMEKVGKDHKIDIVSNGNWFPKAKFDEVNEKVKTLEDQIKERDNQLKELKTKAAGNEELSAKIAELETANEATKSEYEVKMAELKKETAIELKLKDEQAKNVKAVKALLSLDKVSIDGDNLLGLDEQLKTLKESDPYLFGEDKLTGRDTTPPGDKQTEDHKRNPWSKDHFNLTRQGQLLKEDPELAARLKAAAN